MADRDLQAILNSGEISNMFIGGVTSGNAVLQKQTIDANYVGTAGDTAVDKLKFTPTATAPSYVEGQMYYDSNNDTMKIQGPFSDVTVSVGHGMHLHVVNNTGATIPKGYAVQHDGVVGGIVQVKLAIATSFDDARMLGVAAADIPNGSQGAATTFGEIENVDTSSLPAGVPLYLSDTVAGTFTATPPEIISRVGGATVSDVNGTLFVYIINNKNLPNVFGGMQGQTSPTYAVTTTAQDIVNYATESSVVATTNTTAGTVTVPNDGGYRMHFAASISFASATSTRTIYLEFYDQTNTQIEFTYAKNIPRDATEDGVSFSFPIDALANEVFKVRIRSDVAISVTFDDISYDLDSVNLR